MSVCYIKRKDIQEIEFVIKQGGKTGKNMAKEYNPDYLINLALYDMDSGTNITNMEDDNKTSGYLFSNDGIAIKGFNEIIWATKNQAYESHEIQDYVSGSPVLVKDGKINIDWGNKYSSYVDGKHKRSAVGFNDDELILYCSDDSITINTLAHRMLNQFGCKYAINCDGGGSQYLQKANNVIKCSYRKNVSWLLVWMEPKEDFEMYKFTNNQNKSLPVYETTDCKKKIGSLDPWETCDCLYEMTGYKVVLYNITGKATKKVGFIKD